MKYTDYHYKYASLNYNNELERQRFELVNEYGYNFASEQKRIIDEDKLFLRPKIFVNKDFINLKR